MSKLRTVVSLLFLSVVLLTASRAALWAFPAQSRPAKEAGKVAPKVVYKLDPNYTEEATAAGIQGTILLSVEISPTGTPQNVLVTRSLDPGLNRNAIAAVQEWRFEPGLKNGEPVTVRATVEINFKLK